jgi:type IV pilus biogenesis protein CpaD/CtpE
VEHKVDKTKLLTFPNLGFTDSESGEVKVRGEVEKKALTIIIKDEKEAQLKNIQTTILENVASRILHSIQQPVALTPKEVVSLADTACKISAEIRKTLDDKGNGGNIIVVESNTTPEEALKEIKKAIDNESE